MLDRIAEVHNNLSDKNLIWWPFLFLKPDPAEPIDLTRIFKMAVCFGLYGHIVFLIKTLIQNGDLSFSSLILGQLYWTGGFFCWFLLVTSFLWNKRARRLLGEQQ
jgi:hypothetical protein